MFAHVHGTRYLGQSLIKINDVIILIAKSFSHTQSSFEVVEKFSEMKVTNVASQFIQKRPNTSLFVGLLLVSSCIPVAIFLAVVLGFFLVMLTGLLIVQGTIIGLGLTALLVILPVLCALLRSAHSSLT